MALTHDPMGRGPKGCRLVPHSPSDLFRNLLYKKRSMGALGLEEKRHLAGS